MIESTKDILTGFAANMAYQLIKLGTNRLHAAAFGDEEQQALCRVYEYGFSQMFERIQSGLDQETAAQSVALFRHFVSEPAVAESLLEISLGNKDIDIGNVRECFQSAGFDSSTAPIRFDLAITALVDGIAQGWRQEATKPSSPLFNRLSLARLSHLEWVLKDGQQTWIDALQGIKRVNDAAKDIEATEARLHLQALDDYLEALRHYSEQLPYITLPGRPLPLLSKIYIEQLQDELVAAEDGLDESASPPPSEQRKETIEEGLSHGLHIIIEAGPGMGKSTLLRGLSVDLSKRLHDADNKFVPVLVPARGLAACRGSLSESLSEQVSAELTQRLRRPLPADFFSVEPLEGYSWLVMIDGLDEIISPTSRDDLIQNLLYNSKQADSGLRFIITTRPLPNLHSFDSKLFRRYALRFFDLNQIETFARKWFANRPDTQEEDYAAHFLSQVKNSRIAELAHTPLLLTMAAIVYELGGNKLLPAHRSGLYRRFVSILLEDEECNRETREAFRVEWDRRYGQKAKEQADTLFSRRLRLLEYLAIWRQEGNIGSLANEAVRHSYEQGWLSKEIDIDWTHNQIKTLLSRTGLIMWRGEDETFTHNTFREYLVASALARSINPHDDKAWSIVSRWREPPLKEIVLFLFGIWNDLALDLTKLIRWIFETGGTSGLLFSSTIVTEGTPVDQTLEEAMIAKLIAATKKLSKAELWYHPNPFDLLLEFGDKPQVMDGLVSVVRDKRSRSHVRQEITLSFLRMGHREEALDACYRLASENKYWIPLRKRCVKTLAQIGGIDELKALAEDVTVTPLFRLYAVKELGALGLTNQLEPSLISLVQARLSPLLLYKVAQQLRMIGSSDLSALILDSLAYDRGIEPAIRLNATKSLEQIGRARNAIQSLLLLQNEPTSEDFRRHVQDTLDDFLRNNPGTAESVESENGVVREACFYSQLAEVLKSFVEAADRNEYLRDFAADGACDVVVRRLLIKVLPHAREGYDIYQVWLVMTKDSTLDLATRIGLAKEAIGFLTADQVVDIWFELFYDTSLDRSGRYRIAEELLDIQLLEEDAVAFFSSLIEDVQMSPDVRIRSIRILTRFAQIDCLIKVVNDLGLDETIRKEALKQIGQMGDQRALGSLKRVATTHSEKSIRRLAQHSISRIEGRLASIDK